MPISKSWQKLIKSLHLKKYRKQEGLFFVEGEKVVNELLKSDYEIVALFGTEAFFKKNKIYSSINAQVVKEIDLVAVGTFQSNNACLAVVKQKQAITFDLNDKNIILALDSIQDPGNMGTIIRICDWYGIKQVVCSNETVDFYNPKVINASKASFLRVNCIYTSLPEFLEKAKQYGKEIYAAVMNEKNIHQAELNQNAIIVMGNEANGISQNILHYVKHKISIPCFGGAESLNVAVATAVVIDNFFRKTS